MAYKAGEDPPANDYARYDNADQGCSEQQHQPTQNQNPNQQRKEDNTDRTQPRNLNANSVVRAGGC